MLHKGTWRAAACGLTALIVLTPSAQGQTQAPDGNLVQAAQAMLRAGAADYAAGRYASALAKFDEAYRIWQTPAALLNSSRAEMHLGHCDQAWSFAQRYAQEAPASNMKTAREELALLNVDCPEVKVTSKPSGASVWVDAEADRAAGTTPWSGRLPVGRHSLIGRLAGAPDVRASLDVAPGLSSAVELAFAVPPPPPALPPAPIAVAQAPKAPPPVVIVPAPKVVTPPAPQPVAPAPAPLPKVAAAPAPAPPPKVNLVPRAAVAATPPGRATLPPDKLGAPPEKRPMHLRRKLGFAGLGVGAALVVVATGLGISCLASDKSVEAKAGWTASRTSQLASANAEGYASDALFASGAVIGLVGLGFAVVF